MGRHMTASREAASKPRGNPASEASLPVLRYDLCLKINPFYSRGEGISTSIDATIRDT